MEDQPRPFPFRWVLPLAQLAICSAVLWPVRHLLVFELSRTVESYAPSKTRSSFSQPVQIVIAPASAEEQKAAEQAAKIDDLRMSTPVLLDFPVVLAQLPYILVNPAQKRWTPRGMLPDTWRALSWPFVGVLFWWCAGRAIEAFRAARRSLINPRITLVETIFATLLLCIGLVMLVGIITSTPDDRRDLQFLALIAGGLLWGILAALTIAARISQWRISKRGSVLPCLT